MNCRNCGKSITGQASKRYCSKKCKNTFYNQRGYEMRKVRAIQAMQEAAKRTISVLWPGCADPELISVALLNSWPKADIPVGTIIERL